VSLLTLGRSPGLSILGDLNGSTALGDPSLAAFVTTPSTALVEMKLFAELPTLLDLIGSLLTLSVQSLSTLDRFGFLPLSPGISGNLMAGPSLKCEMSNLSCAAVPR